MSLQHTRAATEPDKQITHAHTYPHCMLLAPAARPFAAACPFGPCLGVTAAVITGPRWTSLHCLCVAARQVRSLQRVELTVL